MTNSNYPALLNRRARIFASLNRAELTTLAIIYMILSSLKVGGVTSILVNLCVLVLMKILKARTPRGFFAKLRSPSSFKWRGKLGGIYE